jgi:hypothetical protein
VSSFLRKLASVNSSGGVALNDDSLVWRRRQKPLPMALARGLQHYKADAGKVNSLLAGFNDAQNKINLLADVAADSDRMAQVQGPTAAPLLKQGFGLEFRAFGTKVDLSNVNTAAI